MMKNLLPKYIHVPWNAPKRLEQESDCIDGNDYARFIVDYEVVRKEIVQKLRE